MSTSMGVTNQFAKAQELCAKELGFQISGEASEFRLAIDRAGQKRVEHCITLVRMWARPHNKGAEKYSRLMQLLRLVTPDKAPATKYRNPALAAARASQDQLDRELGDILRREP